MAQRFNIALITLTVVVYVGTVVFGLRLRNLSFFALGSHPQRVSMAWEPPRESNIPRGPLGDSIRRGALIFNETPEFASKYTDAKISCGDCHAEGGIQPYAAPMVGLTRIFPVYSQRAGRVISLKDRVQECVVRSENGSPLSYDGPEMRAILDYINWLSRPQPNRRPFVGRGLIDIPDLKPDPKHGGEIYAMHCAGCHGRRGEGDPPLFPPLWGPDSFNDGAGMNSIHKMAAFVQHNMPQNRTGILSPQDAFDVAAYIHAQPRPVFNQAFNEF